MPLIINRRSRSFKSKCVPRPDSRRQVTLWQDAQNENGIELDNKLQNLPGLLETVYEKYSAAKAAERSSTR